MANTLKHKQSSVAGKVPTTTDLALGELAINTTDGKVYLKKNVSGTESVVEVAPVASVSGKTGAVTLSKGDVGLSNVDNTADASKPISTATQTALDTKQPLDADLTSIASLIGTTGLLKKTAADTWELDTTQYLPLASYVPDPGGGPTLTLPAACQLNLEASVINVLGEGQTIITDGYIVINGFTAWHAGNDGDGSGLDADLLDGLHASSFATAAHTHSYLPLAGGTLTGAITFAAAQTWPTFNQDTTGSAGSVAWSGVTGKPTTLAGYGITDGGGGGGGGGTVGLEQTFLLMGA